MKNRLVRELESYEGYVPEPKEYAKDEVVYDMPESEFDTYEVVVRETTDYVVRIFCKNMDDALDLARDVAESVVRCREFHECGSISSRIPKGPSA